jgi:WD40 repeat protein
VFFLPRGARRTPAYIAFGFEDGTISLFDMNTAASVLTYRGSTGQVESIAWSPGGAFIASAGNDGMVYLWDASNGKLIKSYLARDNFNIDQFRPIELLWSLDNKFLVLDKGGTFLQVWDTLNNASKLIAIDPGTTRALIWLSNGLLTVIDSSKATSAIDLSGL